MIEFIVFFFFLLFAIGLMAIGVMFKRKPLAGSCGGLNAVGVSKICKCENPCDREVLKEKLKNAQSMKF